MSAAESNYSEAQRLARQLVKSSQPQLKCRYMLSQIFCSLLSSLYRALEVIAEVHCACDQPSLALPHLMDSLTLCTTHHLSPYTTQLWLAHTQVRDTYQTRYTHVHLPHYAEILYVLHTSPLCLHNWELSFFLSFSCS